MEKNERLPIAFVVDEFFRTGQCGFYLSGRRRICFGRLRYAIGRKRQRENKNDDNEKQAERYILMTNRAQKRDYYRAPFCVEMNGYKQLFIRSKGSQKTGLKVGTIRIAGTKGSHNRSRIGTTGTRKSSCPSARIIITIWVSKSHGICR